MQITVMRTLDDAMKLLQRFDKGQGFKRYVKSRMRIVVPMGMLIVATGVVFASATIVLAGPRVWLALPSLILAPLILLGSVFVQAFLFFSWLENRADGEGARPSRARRRGGSRNGCAGTCAPTSGRRRRCPGTWPRSSSRCRS